MADTGETILLANALRAPVAAELPLGGAAERKLGPHASVALWRFANSIETPALPATAFCFRKDLA
jgi:hypothetical protein